jgi:hypothetical protein
MTTGRFMQVRRCGWKAIVIALVLARPVAASGDEHATIRTVAVISAIGDSLSLEGVGLLGQTEQSVSIAGWGIDSWITAEVSKRLSGRFTVLSVPINPTSVAQCDGIDQCAGMLPHTDAVDAYVLVLKEWTPGNDRRDFRGIGIWHVPTIGRSGSMVHVVYGIAVISARTGEVINHGRARSPDSGFFGPAAPMEDIAESLWPENAAEMSAAQGEALRAVILDLIARSLPSALKGADLPE